MRTLPDLFDSWWDEISLSVNGSLVFLDDAAAESLHWHGGLSRILECGAIGVRNFSTFEKVSPAFKKAVFVVTTLLTEDVVRTLMGLIQSNSFRSCTLITSLPASCHDGAKDKMFSHLETQMLNWMGNMNYSAEVIHVPIIGLSLLPNVFIMPSLARSIQPVHPEFFFEDNVKKRESELLFLPDDVQRSIKTLSFCLNILLESLQLKGDIFTLGPFSHVAGAELENLCHFSRKKSHSNKASVLLIDRSLDLAGPLSQSVDTPFSKMLRVLPHLSGHVCDVQVNMSDLAHSQGGTVFGLPLLAPGCIAHRNSTAESDSLTTILTSKVKESLMEINRRVVQAGIKEGMSFETTSANALKVLKKRILLYRERPHLLYKNSGLLEQALSVVQVLEHQASGHLDDLLATEKLLLQNFSLTDGIADDIGRLIAHRKERGYKMVEVLTLVAFLYALTNEEILDSESEAATQATVMEALFQEDVDTVELVRKLAGDDADDNETLTAVKGLFNIFKDFEECRKDYKKYRSIFDPGDTALPATYVPLLKQILEDIYASADMPDVEYHSGGLRDYIKTGFSLFMNVAKPQPKDNPVVIIIVLGGMTASEVKVIRDISARHKTPKVIVGTTNLLTPENVMDNLFNVVKEVSTPEALDDFY